MVTDTRVLIQTIKKMYPVVTFFKDRYFPDGKVFYSEKALIECKKGNRAVAPFVIPVVNGIVVPSNGYRAYEVRAPYIAPKKRITALDLERKAFGESPESGKSPAQRQNEIQVEHMDDLRQSITRRKELMCTDIITKGKIVMNHYASADDAAKDVNKEVQVLQYYENEFKNVYRFTKAWSTMTIKEKIQEFYKMASILRKRGCRNQDLVMTADVSMDLFTDEEFLKFYDKKFVDMGKIKGEELPAGVARNGDININGVVFSFYTYDEVYEDLDGEEKPFLPKGTIAMLKPNMGTTVYSQVTFIKGNNFSSYASPIVPRLLSDEINNLLEVQMFSRPVPYPYDWDSWLVANIYSPVVTQAVADNSVDTSEPPTEGATLKTFDQINSIAKKADVITYATSIGLSGLDTTMSLEELKSATVKYQTDVYGD